MRQFLSFLILFIFLCSLFFESNAQQALQDSSYDAVAKDSLISFYKNKIGENLQLYNGQEYIRNGRRAKGFPFYNSPDAINGSVFYFGKLYNNIPIYFDLVTNDVIVNDFSNTGAIKLVPEKINYFTIAGHHFVHLFPDEQNIIRDAFYDQLADGKVALFAKREKEFRVPVNTDEDAKYQEYNYYFVRAKNMFYKIEDESALLDVLKDKKDQVKKFIKANKLNFRKRMEEAVVKTIAYYNQLTD